MTKRGVGAGRELVGSVGGASCEESGIGALGVWLLG